MRRRSKTNSRPWEDLEFRYAYMQENPHCELAGWLVANLRGEVPGLRAQETGTDPHHIMGSSKGRHDVRSNLIAVCRPVHLWCHSKEGKIDGRILAIYVKWKKGEMCADEFRVCSGMYLAGWLSIRTPIHDAIREIWEELKSELNKDLLL